MKTKDLRDILSSYLGKKNLKKEEKNLKKEMKEAKHSFKSLMQIRLVLKSAYKNLFKEPKE